MLLNVDFSLCWHNLSTRNQASYYMGRPPCNANPIFLGIDLFCEYHFHFVLSSKLKKKKTCNFRILKKSFVFMDTKCVFQKKTSVFIYSNLNGLLVSLFLNKWKSGICLFLKIFFQFTAENKKIHVCVMNIDCFIMR